MENIEQEKGHSEEYFGDYRDYWYNYDFLELMAKRWKLQEVDSLLDVGCGQCHWSRLLSNFMAPGASVTAVDNDDKWAKDDEAIEGLFESKGIEFSQRKADVYQLPFEDDSFAGVTCQTLLIHLDDPMAALLEMKRVLRPGGILICAEPNNIAGRLLRDSCGESDTIDEVLEDIRSALICERGKIGLGLGDSSLGDFVPGMLNEAGFDDVKTFLSDKCNTMIPPYQTAEMKIFVDDILKESEFKSVMDEERRIYFRDQIGDGHEDACNSMLRRESFCRAKAIRSLAEGTYHSAGGAVMYLSSGRKRSS